MTFATPHHEGRYAVCSSADNYNPCCATIIVRGVRSCLTQPWYLWVYLVVHEAGAYEVGLSGLPAHLFGNRIQLI